MPKRRFAWIASLTVAAAVIMPGTAQAVRSAPAKAPADEGFYQPPAPLPPGEPGDLIRSQPVPTMFGPLAKATLVMYRSADTHGRPAAVTGTVLEPAAQWTGAGERPLIGFTVGTHGQGDQCAPSKLMVGGLHYDPPLDSMGEYEALFIGDLLSQGMAVVVTDYHGLGTPAVHGWLNRAAEAHANIDAVRAAQRLPGASVPDSGPVGFVGYSQGGGAAAATAELVGSYGSELDVVGTYAGDAPADPHQAVDHVDGTALGGVIGYYVNGLAAAYPRARSVVDAAFNDAGKRMLADVRDQCIVETTLSFPNRDSSAFTTSGEPVADVLAAHPITRAAMEGDRIGDRTPTAPVLLTIGDNDDIVPPGGVRELAAAWCERGATVQLGEIPLPTLLEGTGFGHIANSPLGYREARSWLADRFAGEPAPTTCDT